MERVMETVLDKKVMDICAICKNYILEGKCFAMPSPKSFHICENCSEEKIPEEIYEQLWKEIFFSDTFGQWKKILSLKEIRQEAIWLPSDFIRFFEKGVKKGYFFSDELSNCFVRISDNNPEFNKTLKEYVFSKTGELGLLMVPDIHRKVFQKELRESLSIKKSLEKCFIVTEDGIIWREEEKSQRQKRMADSSLPDRVISDDEFCKAILNGDEKAIASLLKEFKGTINYFVDNLTRKHSLQMKAGCLDPEDLHSVGTEALFKAVSRYDSSKKAKLKTYATSLIKGAMQTLLRDSAGIPRSIYELQKVLISDITKGIKKADVLKRYPYKLHTLIELSLSRQLYPISLYENISGEDSEAVLMDTLVSKERDTEDVALENIMNLELSNNIKAILTEQEYLVTTSYYCAGSTQVQIAKEIGISQMQVSKILAKSHRKLRQDIRIKNLL